jgi:hypothetical protein
MGPRSKKGGGKDWSLPSEVEADSIFIAVSVLGTGSGESIVVNICDKFIGIVDCCEELLPPNAHDWHSGVLGTILSQCHDPVFGFVLLTHPHLDHFAGMERVYRALGGSARRISLFQGITEYELIELFRIQQTIPEIGARAYKFYKRFGSLLDVFENELTTFQRSRAGDATALASFVVRDRVGNAVPVEINCLAPSADDCSAFLSQARLSSVLALSLGTNASLRQQCNRVSVVCRIDFGATRVLLGGDAEHATWRQIKAKHAPAKLQSNIVKISHHGSPTGVDKDLVGVLSKGKNTRESTVALVTPSFTHKLPKAEVLDLLRDHFDEVIVTCQPPDGTHGNIDKLRLRFPQARDMSALPVVPKRLTTVTFDAKGNRIDS